MKFEVNTVRKADIYDSDPQYSTERETKLSELPAEIEQLQLEQQMAGVDTLPPLCLAAGQFIPKGNGKTELVCEWTPDEVIEWMTSRNLYSSLDYFSAQSISGAELIQMTDKSLQEKMGIEDSYQRKTLMVCLDELCGRQASEDDSEGSSTESSDECTSDSSEHDLLEHVFAVPVKCHKCGKYIVEGSTSQGFQCAACGLCLHNGCITGKIQPCNREKLEARKKSHQHAHSLGLLFGSDLCKDVPQSRDRVVPDIIYICTNEIQRQSNINPEFNVIQAYKTQKSSEDISALKRMFDSSADAFTVLVTDVDLFTLCGVVKKYLCELTNPLIPTEWYTEFIETAKLSDSEGITILGSLVNQLPKYHNSTLQFLFNHFYKIVESGQNKEKDAYLSLAQIFCHIILRPEWSEIRTFVDNTQYHLIVLRRLFSLYDNNNTECDKHTTLQGDVNQVKSESQLSYASHYEERLLPLDQYQWYWGEVSREEVQEATSDLDDGSFLVRNATSHYTHGDYTLVLRKGGSNLLIKIYHRHGQYGFCADSSPFESVPALVSYYQHNSLAEYNATLNIRLRRGIARHSQYESFRSSDPHSLLLQLGRNHGELMTLTRENDILQEKQVRLSHDIKMLHQAQESFKELSKIFEEQIDQYTHQESNTENSTECSEVQKNAEMLRARLQSININKDKLGHTIQEKSGSNSRLAVDINTIKPNLRNLTRRQDYIISALLSYGYPRYQLDDILRSDPHPHPPHSSTNSHTSGRFDSQFDESEHSFSNKLDSQSATTDASSVYGAAASHHVKVDVPHMHKSNWYVNCTREEATDRLLDCVDGTFLMRPGRQDYPHSLSIAINGTVGHCKVLFQDGHFGFAEPFITHVSLVDLVLYYKDHSLAHHNTQLTTKLLYPVNQSGM